MPTVTQEYDLAYVTKVGVAWKEANPFDNDIQALTDIQAAKDWQRSKATELLEPAARNAARDDTAVEAATQALDLAKNNYDEAIKNRNANMEVKAAVRTEADLGIL